VIAGKSLPLCKRPKKQAGGNAGIYAVPQFNYSSTPDHFAEEETFLARFGFPKIDEHLFDRLSLLTRANERPCEFAAVLNLAAQRLAKST
jgi:hemerythrin